MKPLVIAASLALLLAASSVAAHPPSAAGPPDAAGLAKGLAGPAAAIDAFHAALARGDGPAVAAVLDETVVIYEEGWVDASKAAYVSGHLPEDLIFMRDMRETRFGRAGGVSGDLAWIASQGRMQGRHDGRDVDRDTAETAVLRRTAAGWRIVQMHWSSHPHPS